MERDDEELFRLAYERDLQGQADDLPEDQDRKASRRLRLNARQAGYVRPEVYFFTPGG